MTQKDVRFAAGQVFDGGAVPGSIQAKMAQVKAVAERATKAFTAGEIDADGYNTVMRQAEQAGEELAIQQRTRTKALSYAANGDSAEYWRANGGGGAGGVAQAKAHKLYTLKSGERWVRPASLQTPGSREWQTLAEAARCKAPMSVEFDSGAAGFGAVQLKGFSDGDVRMKTPVAEGVAGAGGSLVPPVLMPEMYAERLEPDRIWSHLTTVEAVGQWATYLQHPSDTNPAAPTAELGTIPSTGAQYAAKTVVFTKIAAQQAYSVEILEDTNSDVYAFAGSELSRKLIDAESDFLVNNTDTSNGWSKGLLYADDTQSLSALSYDSPIDAILAAYELIRSTTQSFARANLVLVSPATGLALRTVKATTGLYVLDQNSPASGLGQDQFVNLFGATLVQNTKMPDGVAIVLDSTVGVLGFLRSGLRVENTWQTEPVWSQYAWAFRATERLGLAYPWPASIVIVDSMPVTPGLVFQPGGNSS
jgi:HK97 family phage major capsid protein